MDKEIIKAVVEEVVGKITKEEKNNIMNSGYDIPIGVSSRHLHVSREDLETLFGKGYELTVMKNLSQPGQYAANEVVTLIGPKGVKEKVRILGPARKTTQIEISLTDSFALGVPGVIRESGDIESTPGIVISGPKGVVKLDKGVIVAKRHIHMKPADAQKYGVSDKQIVAAEIDGPRKLIFDNVVVRVSEDFKFDFHIDTDEANAAAAGNGTFAKLIK